MKDVVFPRSNVDRDLEYWYKSESDKVLNITGARQTGKTFYIRNFVRTHYSCAIYIDLFYNQKFIKLIKNINPNKFASKLSKYFTKKFGKFEDGENTVIIIDEVQICPEIINNIRLFNDELKSHVIFVSSYLSFVLEDSNVRIPAGDTFTIEFTPLTFSEFREAVTVLGISHIPEYKKFFQISGFETNISLTSKLYDLYRYIGGYPQVLKIYIKSNYKLSKCDKALRDIWDALHKDSCNYFKDKIDENIINNYITYLMFFLQKSSKNALESDYKVLQSFTKSVSLCTDFDNLFKTLTSLFKSAGILGECLQHSNGSISSMPSDVKYYIRDVGLFRYLESLCDIDKEHFEGNLTECYVYNELRNVVLRDEIDNIPHCSVYGVYQLDFMIKTSPHGVFGIEVKTKNGSTKSLDAYYTKNLIQYKIKCGYFSNKNYVSIDSTLNYPLTDVGIMDFDELVSKFYIKKKK